VTDDIVVLDAVSVAMIARTVRDLSSASGDLGLLPDVVAAGLRSRGDPEFSPTQRACLVAYAVELDEIAEAAVLLDQHEHEIEHQLHWWNARVDALEGRLTGHPVDDIEIALELALFRGRISGAQAMRRHYAQQRAALARRHGDADAGCARRLAQS
jgi:hypothetical protein